MSKWFSKATNVFKGSCEELPQPFELHCECGVRHAGLRKKAPQRIICRGCGSSLFILPRDVYPIPKVVAEPPVKAAAPAPAKAEPEPAQSELAPVESILDEVVVLDDEGTRAPRKPRPAKKEPVAVAPKEPRKPPEQFLRPYHFILAAVVGVVLLTVFLAIRSRARERAILIYKEEAEKGLAAVVARSWIEARSHLDLAGDAADLLGRTDPASVRVRQYRAETTALNLLAPASLVDILDEAERTLPDNYNSWPAEFHSKYGGRWLVLEVPVKQVEGAKKDKPKIVVDWSIPIGEIRRPVEIAPIPALGKLKLSETPQNVILGVQLESVAWEKANRKDTVGKWVVTFDPDKSVLWTDLATYEGAGMSFSDEYRPSAATEQALREQREALGLETAPAAKPDGDAPPTGDGEAVPAPASEAKEAT